MGAYRRVAEGVTGSGTIAVAARYGIAGLANTAVGLGVIGLLDFGLGVAPWLANLIGFAAGLAAAFVLNRRFVFKGSDDRGVLHRFALAFAVAFGANQAVLAIGNAVLPAGGYRGEAIQFTAVATYTVIMFLICRAWVYRPSA